MKHWIIGLLAVVMLPIVGLSGRHPGQAAPLPIEPSPVHVITNCFPGTGVPPAPLPYPKRAFLPIVVTPSGACSASEIEPNDTHTDATSLTSHCLTGQAAASSDLDWYRVDLCSAAPSLGVWLHGPAGADLDLYLYGNPPGIPLASSENAGSEEFLMASNPVTGTYYILVSPVSGSGYYQLEATLAMP